MKDRLIRTDKKKVSHRVKLACILTSVFGLLVCSVSTLVLVSYTQRNVQVADEIDNYNYQINYIEKQTDNIIKNNKK